jgi:hypothetical protein
MDITNVPQPIIAQPSYQQKEISPSKTLLKIEIEKTKQERQKTKQETKKIILKKLEITKLKLELELKRLII